LQQFADVIEYINVALFFGLGVAAIRLWARTRNPSTAWFAVSFGTLLAVTVAGLILPDEPQGESGELITEILVSVLLLYPYSLFRFTTTLIRSSRPTEILAGGMTFGLIVWTFLLGDFPAEGEPRSDEFVAYLVGLLVMWTVLSVIVAFKLWRGGRSEPRVARQRMRLLSIGTIGLNVVLIIAGSGPSESAAYQVTTGLMTIVAALFFYMAFAPPAVIQTALRTKEQEELRKAIPGLMTASHREEVADALLPHIAAMFGGRGAAIIDKDADVIGAVGVARDADPSRLATDPGEGVVKLDMPFGAICVWTNPYTPFFGAEDFGLLKGIGVLTDLALERCRFLSVEQAARAELERINAELGEAQKMARLGSFEWNVAEDQITWSEELYRLFGVSPEEFGASYDAYLELIHPDDRDKVNAIVDKAYRTGQGYELEHRILRPDGEVRYVNSRGTMELDADGQVARFIGTAQDVTEQKMSEAYERELRESEMRRKQALELNDNVVQGLAVAGMALEIGETDKAKEAVKRTMTAAQSIISGLLRQSDLEVRPGDLVRAQAARVTDRSEEAE
jgi:PAS domain S-box-containing protein